MPELIINRPDDTNEYDSTLVRLNEENSYCTETIHTRYHRNHSNPVISSIKDWTMTTLGMVRKKQYRNTYWGNRGYHNPTYSKESGFSKILYIGEGEFPVHIQKKKTRYYVNGMLGNKTVLIAAIARTIYKSCFTDDNLELNDYLVKHISLPELVSYAIENRAPYYFYIEMVNDYGNPYHKKIECRLKTNLVGNNRIAVEISDGVWGEMTLKQMNVYMNTYHNNWKRGSWANLSPTELWCKLMSRKATESGLQLMLAFLSQNRTSKVSRERARDLMIHISDRYSDRLKINWGSEDKLLDVSEKPTIMYIHGKLADWKLTDRGLKSQGQQNVSTFVWVHKKDEKKGQWAGPICVDNLDNKSPTGDQFVTRALGLLNDDLLVERVNTISGYLNNRHVLGQTTQRISLF